MMVSLVHCALSTYFHKCKYLIYLKNFYSVFFISFCIFRIFDEVSTNVHQIIQRQLTPLPHYRNEIENDNLRSDLILTCSTKEQCSPNDSKKYCYANRCVECHRNNQCVRGGKLKCNTQTFECEAGRILGAYMTRKLATQNIIGEMEKQEQTVMELKTGTVPNLVAGIRYCQVYLYCQAPVQVQIRFT